MKYTLPAPKKVNRKTEKGLISVEEDDLRWMRQVRLPANKELIDSLNVGETATIILTGKVIGLEMRERESKSPKGEIELSVNVIETEGEKKNVFTEMAKEEESMG